MKSRISIILFILVCSLVIVNGRKDWENNIFIWDKSGYHLHLPAAIIYKDIKHLAFYSYIDEVYQPTGLYFKNFCIYDLENGNRIDRYNIGVAVHELPFFLVAHAINKFWLSYPQDGYSLPYQWGGIISNMFWVVLGLFALRRLLLRYFGDGVTAMTLLCIAFGTNLYMYVAFTPAMAHTYAFFQFSFILLFTDGLYRTGKKQYFYLLAFFFGLIAITRTSNLLVGIIPLLWGINSMTAAKERMQFLGRNALHIAGAAVVFICVAMIQLGYWKYITGHWFYDGYFGEGFIWTEPMILKGLLGFRKGWFIYTPIAVFMLAGIFFMSKTTTRTLQPAVAVFMVFNIYVVFCWWNWWYGGSFSARALIESLTILSLPLASLLEQLRKRSKPLRVTIGTVLVILIALNLFQSYQYKKNILYWDNMTKAYYFKVFLKTKKPEGADKLLLTMEEVEKEQDRRKALLSGK